MSSLVTYARDNLYRRTVSHSLAAALMIDIQSSHLFLTFPDIGFSFWIYCWPNKVLAVSSLNLVPTRIMFIPSTCYSKRSLRHILLSLCHYHIFLSVPFFSISENANIQKCCPLGWSFSLLTISWCKKICLITYLFQ